MAKNKFWNVYIMSNNKKTYLCKGMTTNEAYDWLERNCKHDNGDYFMCGNKVFFECR